MKMKGTGTGKEKKTAMEKEEETRMMAPPPAKRCPLLVAIVYSL